MDNSRDTVSVERVIPAPPEAIFALLADPATHEDIDGSGTLRGSGSQELVLGSEFGMDMRWFLPYRMKNTVIEYDVNRRIAWQTRAAYPIANKLAAGRIWRYELEPVEGGTRVRETWDISQERPLTKPLVKGLAEKTRNNMTRTLERIESLLASR